MRTAVINLAALFGALVLSIAIVPWGGALDENPPPSAPSGQPVLRDASGQRFQLQDYQRIASASPVADELLLELCEPDRIVAFTGHSQRRAIHSYRYQGKETIELITDVEYILSLKPDLVLAHNLTDPRHVQRLREAGIPVFDFGSIDGLSTLWEDIRVLATLIGHPERGEALAARLRDDLDAIARDIPPQERKRALYATVVGTRIYGGTLGSSYHDVLTHAGLVDIAAEQYERWPSYSTEQLLELDPPMIVTGDGSGEVLCRLSGLEQLQACSENRVGVVEIDSRLLDSAALGIVDAARAVRNAAYPPGGVP